VTVTLNANGRKEQYRNFAADSIDAHAWQLASEGEGNSYRKEGVRYSGLYCVEFDREFIVVGSRNPEHDLARALLARGLTGKVTMLDAKTGKPHTVIDIAKVAELFASGHTARARITARPRPKTILSFPPNEAA
jgi:hypothetical protein